jgi:hypothetical protein
MTSSGRLQNLFINRCVPAGERASRMLLEIPGGEIAWVEGMPSGEAFRVTAATRRVLVLRRGE